ncbi:MAG: hypothetical protein FJ405_13745, partial [Verrucomicrobia bacterium]|nr:hypothetical protein [Verrucomicrobiota bacterium]
MKACCPSPIVVSMTANGFSSECRDVSPETIIGRIRAGRWRQKIEKLRTSYAAAIAQGQDAKKAVSARKKALPGVLWSGRFSRRANEGLLEHSGLLCGDLDHLGSHMAQIRAILLASPYLWALFTSPTGTGLKVVFRVEADPAQHAASFKAVQEHVRELVQVGIDVACSDVARLCFVSYDPDAILNSAAQVLAPCTELAKDHPRSVLCPQVSAAVRQQIAAELLGPVDWASETSGFCACPGRDLHTNANGPRDCKIHIDGVPTLHCFHSSCRSAVEQANHELRSRIGKAELRSSVSRPAGSTCERETTSDEQAFTRLAALSPADYDRNRAAEAQQLGIRAATLDTEVARRRPQADRAQRTSVDFPTAEPWPEAVHGAQILNDLADTFTRYLALPTGAKDALALWTAHTHCFEAFLHTPRLNLHSPEKGCGKTTLLDLLASLVLRPLRTESITP